VTSRLSPLQPQQPFREAPTTRRRRRGPAEVSSEARQRIRANAAIQNDAPAERRPRRVREARSEEISILRVILRSLMKDRGERQRRSSGNSSVRRNNRR